MIFLNYGLTHFPIRADVGYGSAMLRKLTKAALASSTVLCLTACNSGGQTVRLLVIGDSHSLTETPARLFLGGQLIHSATAEGLVSFDEKGQVSPALADRWIVTNDGLSYIFRLRDGIWPDGSRMTGAGAKLALDQAIAAQHGTPLALDLANIAEVRAMAGRVLEVRLSHQLPDLLQVLAQPELGLAHRGRGAGPMAIKHQGQALLLTPIAPEKRGLPSVTNWSAQARKLRLNASEAEAAVDAFDEGKVNMVLGGTITDFPLAAGVGLLRGAVRLDPVSGLFGLQVINTNGFLSKPENREALAMAIDRPAIGGALSLGGWTTTTRLSPTEQTHGRWSDASFAQSRALASNRVMQWRKAHGQQPEVAVSLPSGPGSDSVFTRLQIDFSTIGVNLHRAGPHRAADLILLDRIARYTRTSWYLNQFDCAVSHGPCSAAADALASQARQTDDEAARVALELQAEDKYLAANLYIPIGTPVRWSLVNGRTTGFFLNRTGLHPLLPLAMSAP